MANSTLESSSSTDRSPIIQSVERAAVLLSQFTAETPKRTLSELSAALGLNKSTTHRYALSLRSTGLLQYDPVANIYSVGPKAIALAGAAFAGVSFLDVAETHLRHLSETINESVALSIWDGDGPVVVQVVSESNSPIQAAVRVGRRPTPEMAQYRVFRAYRALAAYKAGRGPALDPESDEIVSTGMALAAGDIWRAISCPVFDGEEIVATIVVMGVKGRLAANPASPVCEQIRTAAADLSREITASRGQLRIQL